MSDIWKICKVEDCDRPKFKMRYCQRHYHVFYRRRKKAEAEKNGVVKIALPKKERKWQTSTKGGNQYGSFKFPTKEEVQTRQATALELKKSGMNNTDISQATGVPNYKVGRDLKKTFENPKPIIEILENNPVVKNEADKKRQDWIVKLTATIGNIHNWMDALVQEKEFKGLKDLAVTMGILEDKRYRAEGGFVPIKAFSFEEIAGINPDQLNIRIREMEIKLKKGAA